MNMTVKHTPLSIAVIAGRTAWQSFHKGGNYEKQTNNITEEDFNFLDKLFNKYKHLSVSEHIWFIVNIDVDFYVSQKIKECNYSLISEKRDEIAFNLRTIYELYDNCDECLEFFNNVLYKSHSLIWNLFFKEGYRLSKKENNDFQKIENEYAELLYKLKSNNFNFRTFRIKNVSRALLQEFVRHDDLLGITVKSTRYTLKELKDEKEFELNEESFERAKKYIVPHPAILRTQIMHLEDLRKMIKNNNLSNDIVKYILPECYKTEFIVTLPERNYKNFLKLRDSKDALWEIQRLAKAMKEIDKGIK